LIDNRQSTSTLDFKSGFTRPRFKASSSSPFSAEVQAAARDYLDSRGDNRYGNVITAVKASLLALCALVFYALAMQTLSAGCFVAWYVAMFLMCTLLSVNTMHDASHHARFRSRALNELTMRIVTLPLGIEPAYWQARHVRYHHQYANIEHCDLDTTANRFLRQSPFQPWHPQFRFQHLYWPLVAGLSMPYISLVYDWADRLALTPIESERLLPGLRGWSLFAASKLLHLAVFLAAPLYFVGPSVGYGAVIFGYALGLIGASCVLLTLILGTHWADTQFFELDDSEALPHTRDAHAFLTCCDWMPRPRALHALLGGLNLHLTHHLFPSYGHRHYAELARIVERTAQRHGMPYRCLSHFELLSAQQRFLRSMGQRPAHRQS
jgi:linoleoyl-CoA desaturase